eukprot:gnl/MRDRNA2_/MRDRNA2_88836_c0_seq1.p1 gnl/MRDRNA2_/MRDRNA2_88836_c0~~gnl/MRDRNA2_/MRDRNA2_88836_c0_seq1.p1  ORF type:complete len:261 (-),score=62.53 gnl/MRDRNA2_/MRDRNA2_88836_c0_seq1:168-950(-)
MRRVDGVCGPQSQLLQEVRLERQQCFAVAEAAARNSALDCSASKLSEPLSSTLSLGSGEDKAGRQTPYTSRSMQVIPVPAAVPGHGASDWNAQDDIDQEDALKSLQFLGEQIGRSSELEAKLAEAPSREEQGDELIHLQVHLASLRESLAKERDQRESMQHQMMCLEQELDAKEATINDLERDLERKDEELSHVQRGQKRAIGCDDSRVRALEHQLRDREQQLEAKDGHIARLLSVLRQHRGKYFDEESTVCPSDRSIAL